MKGRRQRLGAQFDWTPGPTWLRAEWMQSREQRHGQSNRNEDLSDFIGTAWYVSGTWFVTGEDKDDNINARRPLFEGGLGAIELAVRYEQLGFDSASKTRHRLHQSARGAPAAEHATASLTFGVNWITTVDARDRQRDPRGLRGCDAHARSRHDVVLVGPGSAAISCSE